MFGFGKKKEKKVELATNLPTPVPPLAFTGQNLVLPVESSVRVPLLGDRVWWAPKQLECIVISVGPLGFTFQGGELVKKSKRTVPRWTVYTGFDHKWDEAVGSWIVGEGQTPKSVRGLVVKPDPVKIDLSAYGVR